MTAMRSRRAGFTLVELLLAVALLSMIVGAILGGLHIGKRVWETGRDYEAVAEVEEATQALSDLLAHAYPLFLPRRDSLPVAAFEGQTTRCRIIATSEGDSLWGGLSVIEIGVDDAGALAVWTRVYRPDDGFGLPREAMASTQALKNVTRFELSYFGVLERDHPPVWTDAWADRQTTPKLVSLRIGVRRGGRDITVTATSAPRQQ